MQQDTTSTAATGTSTRTVDDTDGDTEGWLVYPRNFFRETTGASPSNEEEAALLWNYRKSRPAKGTSETEVPNGAEMMKEVAEIRHSLRQHIQQAFLEEVRALAQVNGMKTPTTNDDPVLEHDFKSILAGMENITDNHNRVFNVFHEFHRDRMWMAIAIDNWLRDNQMKLAPPHEITKRIHSSDRGGFGVVARQAKASSVKSFMRYMLSKAGWNIVTSKKKEDKFAYVQVKRTYTCFYVCTETNRKV